MSDETIPPDTDPSPTQAADTQIADAGAPEGARGGAEEALAAANDKYIRLAAEYDNFRRRTLKEKAEASDRGAILVVSRLLDALDDFDRLEASAPPEGSDPFRDGFALVRRKLQQALEATGLERIAPHEVPFDPKEHDAVSVAVPERPEQDHLVKMTLQPGYRFKGAVVRPARVQVYSEQGTA